MTTDPDEHSGISQRKREHLNAALGSDVAFRTVTTGLQRYALVNRALPELDLDEVDLATKVFDRHLNAPLLISCMTGGVGEAGSVNRALAEAAQSNGVGMGLGSGRALLEDPSKLATFAVREVAPDVLLFANLGAVQLHRYSPQACLELVGLCEADGLVLHLNAVQEAVQPGGDTEFGGLADRIAETVAALHRRDIPVIVKEVGFGMSHADITLLLSAGVDGIDVAGAGGTNWATVEGVRRPEVQAVAEGFADWGTPTVDSLLAVRRALTDANTSTMVIASGGISNGVDGVKALCLGADLVASARGLLSAAATGTATGLIAAWIRQMRIATWASGTRKVGELGPHNIVTRTAD